MVWYYADGDRQRGPISDEEFEEMVTKGRIRAETLVWKDGMENWKSLENTRDAGLTDVSPVSNPDLFPSSPVGDAPTVPSVPVTEAPQAEGAATCSQCGRWVSNAADGVQLGKLFLCKNCDADLSRHYHQQDQATASTATPWPGESTSSPSYKRRVESVPGALVYASIISRAAAKFIDYFLQTVIFTVLAFFIVGPDKMMNAAQHFQNDPEQFFHLLRPFMLGALVFRALYDAVLVGLFGATLGKMVFGLKVVTPAGDKVGFGQAIIRAVAPAILQLPEVMLSAQSKIAAVAQFVFLFGYIIAAFDPYRRTLYDHAAGTRVVK